MSTRPSKRLYLELTVRLLLSLPFMGLLLFLPAGTLRYWEAWLFGAVFFACNLVMTLYLLIADPQLLERRLRVGPTAEKTASQKLIMVVALLFFAGAAVLPALDHRFGWSDMPVAVVLLGDALIILSYVGFLRVFRANTYGAATVQVEAGQKVISTGPYAIVRHPMYSFALVMTAGMPLALGSWYALLTLVPGAFVLAWRLLDEERYLHRNLPGYTEYTRKVRWRLLPGVF
jgi:protein-S-isoprenylcysteine O-methyltransferase Ste14